MSEDQTEEKKDVDFVYDRDVFKIEDGKLVCFDNMEYKRRYWKGPKWKESAGVEVPKDVTVIGKGAFRQSSVTGVRFLGDVEIIGEEAFSWCGNLKSVHMGGAVKSIGYRAFTNCKSLWKVEIPDSLTSIADGAFLKCKKLREINLPDNLEWIGNCAFRRCESLDMDFVIPPKVPVIGYGAFMYCANLKSIYISGNVTKIGRSAFKGCESLERIIFEDPENWVLQGEDESLEDIPSDILRDPQTASGFFTDKDGEIKIQKMK